MEPTDQQKLQAVANDLGVDVSIAMGAVQAQKTGGTGALFSYLAEHAEPVLHAQLADVEAVLPVLKAGYMTTEFWLTLGAVAFNVLWPAISKTPVPLSVNGSLAGVISIYTISRALVKHGAVSNSPTQTTTTTDTAPGKSQTITTTAPASAIVTGPPVGSLVSTVTPASKPIPFSPTAP